MKHWTVSVDAVQAGRLAVGTRHRIRRVPCRWCGQHCQATASNLGKHEANCPEKAEEFLQPATCLTCGIPVPPGTSSCWEHEAKDARFAELDELIAAEERRCNAMRTRSGEAA
jgi:hypothetical protein